ncbi:MAG: mandelate racemase [Rhizobiales bacterium]|nr:mandelate racemase [Hyphomicrobiales bacterium]
MDAPNAQVTSRAAPRLTIRDLKTVIVEVPMTFALGTSAATVRKAPLILVDLQTEEGITGRTYLFCYRASGAKALAALLADAVEVVRGKPAAPVEIGQLLARRFTLLAVSGLARMALAAFDGALWDALARAASLPLATMLGASPRPVRAYNSSGLGLMTPEAAADEAEALLDRGFKAVKLRLGYATLAEDLAVTRAVRRRIPDEVEIFVDYNQALDVPEALKRGRALESEGIAWFEEPIRYDDYAGYARLTRELTLPVQLGENFDGTAQMAEALRQQACDLAMPDFARIGGVTGWMQAAGIASAYGIPMSSHLLPEVSAHLLAATPSAHWLEYVDWGDAILEEPLEIRDGHAVIPDRPGAGMSWDMAAVKKLRID